MAILIPASQNSNSPNTPTLNRLTSIMNAAHARLSIHSGTSLNQYCKKLPAAITSMTHTDNHRKQYIHPITKDTLLPNASCTKSFIFLFLYTVAISAIAAITTSSNNPAKIYVTITPGPASPIVSALPLKIPVPMTPPIAIKLMCLGLSFFCNVPSV
ncbi:hypothetical protein D3C76_1229680 [compost metagenome]